MLAGLLAFEWRYHTRRLTFAVAALALAGFAVLMVATGYGPEAVDVNAPYVVTQSLGLLSLTSVFVLTFFCADAALRDVEHGMAELVLSRPVGRARLLLGRYAGALLAGLTVFALATLVLMLAPLAVDVEPERLGAVRPLAYAWAFALLVLPNLALVAALLFAVAALTRSALATYVGAVALYALYMVVALAVDSPLMAGAAPPTPAGLARAALLDPFGLSAFFEQTRYWTPEERDVRHLALAGRVLLNRAGVLALTGAVLALVVARFEPRTARRPRVRALRPGADPAPRAAYRPAAPAAGRGTLWPALRSSARLAARHALGGWTTLALLVLWVFVVGMEASSAVRAGEYGTRLLPSMRLMLDAAHLPLLLLGTVTLVYFAAELAWRERVVGVAPLVDATPAPGAVPFLASLAALWALVLALTLAAVAVCLVVQLLHGGWDVRPGVYLSLLWFGAAPLCVFAVGALALQAVAPNRWVGMGLGLLLAAVARRGQVLGLEHPLLRFGAVPEVGYSGMDGFGPEAPSFAAFLGLWALAAALLAVLAGGLWRRGEDTGARARLAGLWGRLGPAGRGTAVACGVAFALAWGLLYRETRVVHRWEGTAARRAWRADYERAYRATHGAPQPSIVGVRTRVDLHPEARRAEVEGAYALENRTAVPLDTLWVRVPDDVEGARLEVPGAALQAHDARFGVSVFQLPAPLAPGGRAELRFAFTVDRGGVRADGFDTDVTDNGTYLTQAVYPSLGYRPGLELVAPALRRAQGLVGEATARVALADAPLLEGGEANRAWAALDVTVTTPPDQTALAPGRLVRAWEEGGRRHFHYASARPQTPLFAVASARYAVRRARAAGVDVEVWYHPAHALNVERILAAATRSLEVLTGTLGPFPHPVLRVAEVPAWSRFGGFALPGLVLFTEDRGFLADARGVGGGREVDLITRRVAHEVAHQWWGHWVDPADVAGATTLVETLAKDAEARVIAAVHGEDALPAMLAFDEDRYLAGRASAPRAEVPLLEATEEAYLYYGKGALVMHGLRGLLGSAAVDRALARLVREHGGPGGAATAEHLRALLRAEAPGPAEAALVDAWLAGRVVHDVRVVEASVEGRVVRARVEARRTGRPGAPAAPEPADGEVLEVEVLDAAGQRLHLGRAAVVGGVATLEAAVEGTPALVVADPQLRRIDPDRSDNRRPLAAR